MIGKTVRDRLLASTIMAGSIAIAMPAFAQTTPQAPVEPAAAAANPAPNAPPPVSDNGQTAASSGGEIIVTGSRIPHPNLDSASPVTVVGAAEVKLTGTTRTEDLLNSLPSVFASQGSGVSNGSTGTATIDLRGLGDVRTLVLVNGRRLVPGDPGDPVADINIIPAALIKRVDVLTGGASSVYGADAVAGVVNFVMDTDFSGFRIDSQYSFYQHDNNAGSDVISALQQKGDSYPTGNTVDGAAIDTTVTVGAGTDDGRGHVTAYGEYRKINPVLQSARDYSACALGAGTVGRFVCGGSSTSPTGTFFTNVGTFHVDGNSLLPNAVAYNYGPLNYYQRPDERYTAGFFAHYDVSDAFKPYSEFMFMDDRSVAQIAASGDFGNPTFGGPVGSAQTFSINCDNPLLSVQEHATLCAAGNLAVNANTGTTNFTDASGTTYQRGVAQILRRDVEGGPRQDDLQHTTYRGVIGAKGDIAKGISYDAYYQYGRVDFAETYFNDFSIRKIGNALDVVQVGANGQVLPYGATGGTVECRSVLDGSDPSCVPWNIFQTGGVTQGAINYLATPGFQRGRNTEQVADASVTFLGGDYGITSPWANEGVALNVGAEYRKETLTLDTDQEFTTGDLAGQGAPTIGVAGAFNVKEVFAELSVPLVQDKPFFHDLNLDGGYRRSHYETSAGTSYDTTTWKIQGEWAPIRDIRFRGGYNRAVRAPNIVELFAATRIGLDGTIGSDPCMVPVDANGNALRDSKGNIVPPTDSLAQCERSGMTAAQYGTATDNPAHQYYGQLGGNVNLKPEISNSWTVGAVLQPTFLRGFNATVDYFNIKVKNDIGVIGAQNILNACLNDDLYCNLVHRDASGTLWRSPAGYITDTNLNAGGLKTSGVDVGVGYTTEIGSAGTLGFDLQGTWLHDLTSSPVGVVPYNCAGYYGAICGTPNPKWRHTARITYTLPSGPSLSVAWRYFSKVREDTDSSNPTLAGPKGPGSTTLLSDVGGIKAQSYFDANVTFPVADKFTFRVGAQNILDRSPPLSGLGLAGTFNGNTYPVVYDALGRYIYMGVTFDL